jgi:ABC-type Fe3+-hydroxamate transport system substrate-binding protein
MIQPDIEAIASIRPDLVLFSMEDNPTQHTERLAVTGIASYVFPRNPDFNAISENYMELARLVKMENLAEEKMTRYRLDLAYHRVKRADSPRIAFFVSHRPLIAASGASFLGKIIADAGAVNIFGEGTAPYPLPSLELLVLRNPQFIVSIMPDAGRFFPELLKDFPGLEAVKHRRIYYIKPDHWGYYTPSDYVAAVRQLASILDGGGKGR